MRKHLENFLRLTCLALGALLIFQAARAIIRSTSASRSVSRGPALFESRARSPPVTRDVTFASRYWPPAAAARIA